MGPAKPHVPDHHDSPPLRIQDAQLSVFNSGAALAGPSRPGGWWKLIQVSLAAMSQVGGEGLAYRLQRSLLASVQTRCSPRRCYPLPPISLGHRSQSCSPFHRTSLPSSLPSWPSSLTPLPFYPDPSHAPPSPCSLTPRHCTATSPISAWLAHCRTAFPA